MSEEVIEERLSAISYLLFSNEFKILKKSSNPLELLIKKNQLEIILVPLNLFPLSNKQT